MLKRILFLQLCTLCLSMATMAQDEEYRGELGLGAGGCFYLGDANGTPYRNLGPMFTLVGRRVFNPRMALKANLGMGHISGDTSGRYFPSDALSETSEGGQPGSATFKRNVFDLSVQFELNLLGYGLYGGYQGHHRLVPYLALGVGATFAPKPVDAVFAFNIPMGLGVKFKLKERWNLGLEWSIRFTTTDALDVSNAQGVCLDDPYGIKSGGFKNKDCYSWTTFYVTYDLFPKCKTCNKI